MTMFAFTGTVMGVWSGVMIAGDDSIRQTVDVWLDGKRGAQFAPWSDGIIWPNSRMMGGDNTAATYLVGQDANSFNRFEGAMNQADSNGNQSTLKIKGITRDSSGNPLGYVTVQVFRTSDDLFVSQMTSDAGGYFEAPTPYPSTNHYLVCYKAGSPNVGGTSVDTLQGV